MSSTPDPALDVTIITGMSGAGRSEAANVLEDLGLFVIDNLPPALISKVAELARTPGRPIRYGLVVDVRAGEFIGDLEVALEELRGTGAHTRILFLDAADEVLVRRYDATRRRHPLAEHDRVSEGIVRERELLANLKARADIVIDTGSLNVHELRDRLREAFSEAASETSMNVSIVSFGYKYGIPIDADMILDCRFLPNPHWIESLRKRTGANAKVRKYVLEQAETEVFLERLDELFALLMPAFKREGKAYLSIGIGCTGGRHRSVVLAIELARLLAGRGVLAQVHHRDIERG